MGPEGIMSKNRNLLIRGLITGIIVLLLAWYFGSTHSLTVELGSNESTIVLPQDDAYITLAYARTLAQGGGLRWYPGAQAVEGFSSFLWVVTASIFYFVIGDPLFSLIMFCGLLHAVAVWLLWRIFEDFHVPWWAIVPFVLLVALWLPNRQQVLSANEFSLMLAIFLFSILAAIRLAPGTSRDLILGSIIGFLPIIRPEGALFAAVVLAFRAERSLTFHQENPQVKAIIRSLLITGGVAVIPLCLLAVFRLHYFGDPLPNTYFLKMVGRPDRIWWGARDVYGFLRNLPGVLYLLPASFLALLSKTPGAKSLTVGFYCALIGIAYMGGDAWAGWRFYGSIFALYCLILGLAAKEISTRTPSHRVLVVAFAAWSALFALIPELYREYKSQGGPFPLPSSAILEFAEAGISIRSACQTGAVIAVFPAGAIPYYAERPSIDMLGKSDRHIARQPPIAPGLPPGHDKVDFDYVLGRKPDLIVADPFRLRDPTELDRLKSRSFGRYLFEFYSEPSIQSAYEPAQLPNGPRVYVRQDSIECRVNRIEGAPVPQQRIP